MSLFSRAIEADSSFAPSYIHAIELSNRYGAKLALRVSRAYLARGGATAKRKDCSLAADLEAPNGTKNEKLRAYIDTVSPTVIQTAATRSHVCPTAPRRRCILMRTVSERPDALRAPGFRARTQAHRDAWTRRRSMEDALWRRRVRPLRRWRCSASLRG